MARLTTWTDQADARLLAAIIETCPAINYQKVADILGGGLTANAVNHRIRKIKARANGVESNSSTPAGTPRKAQPATPRKVDETKKRPRGEESLEDSIAVEDSKKLKTEMEQSMTTPQATPKNRKAEKAVKTEVEEKAEEPVVKVE